MKYETLEPITRTDASAAAASADPRRLSEALLRAALHEPNRKWVEDLVAPHLASAEPAVCRAAVLALAHLARIHRGLDTARFLPTLRALGVRSDLDGAVQDALEDIAIFVDRAHSK